MAQKGAFDCAEGPRYRCKNARKTTDRPIDASKQRSKQTNARD